jgi:hypothetical protein
MGIVSQSSRRALHVVAATLGWLLVSVVLLAPSAARGQVRPMFPVLSEIVVDNRPAPSWGTGPIALISDPGDFNDWFLMSRSVDVSRLPARARAWLGARVRISQPDGGSCDATVKSLRLIGIGSPSRKQLREYERIAREEGGDLTAPRHQRFGVGLWRTGTRLLVAATEPSCRDGTWAWPDSTEIAGFARAVPVPQDSPLYVATLAAFRAMPAHAAIQGRWARSPRGRKQSLPWDSLEEEPIAWSFQLPSVTLVIMSAGLDRLTHGVGAELGAVWEVHGPAEHPELVTRVGPKSRPRVFDLVVEMRGDRRLLFLSQRMGAWRETGGGRLVEDKSTRMWL